MADWTQLGSDIDGEAASDYSGGSVSLSDDGSFMAIGANYNDGTASNAGHVRIYAWNKQGESIPGLSKADLATVEDFIANNPELQVFADQLIAMTKGSGYNKPTDSWLSGTITTDLMSVLNNNKRKLYLKQWQDNVDLMFSEKNLNKLEAAFGSYYREALENMLHRMETGSNRGNRGSDRIANRFLDYVNNSVGIVMFFNMRSALLQTISAVNFVNWSDNNMLAA